MLSVGCEYRQGKHLLIKAFYAKTPYQTLFTLLQSSKDIERKDLGKLTYIGYIGIVLSTIGAVCTLLYSFYQCYKKIPFSVTERFQVWVLFSGACGFLATIIQMIDSFLGWLIGLFR